MSPKPAEEFRIVGFRDEFAADFARLNREWIEAYEWLEESDVIYLSNPRGNIIDQGGTILFALQGQKVVGTVAVLPLAAHTFEIAKLAVAPHARGLGLGRRLMESAIYLAKSLAAVRLVLSSHSRLIAAIRLYESLGFRPTSDFNGIAYSTADVFMELQLGTSRSG